MLASVSCLVSPRKGDAPLSLDKPERRTNWKNKQQGSSNSMTVAVSCTFGTFVDLCVVAAMPLGK